jgi:hypothetical protein
LRTRRNDDDDRKNADNLEADKAANRAEKDLRAAKQAQNDLLAAEEAAMRAKNERREEVRAEESADPKRYFARYIDEDFDPQHNMTDRHTRVDRRDEDAKEAADKEQRRAIQAGERKERSAKEAADIVRYKETREIRWKSQLSGTVDISDDFKFRNVDLDKEGRYRTQVDISGTTILQIIQNEDRLERMKNKPDFYLTVTYASGTAEGTSARQNLVQDTEDRSKHTTSDGSIVFHSQNLQLVVNEQGAEFLKSLIPPEQRVQ